jgi:hypothetical protein
MPPRLNRRPIWLRPLLPLIAALLFLSGIIGYIAAQTTYEIKLYPIADAEVTPAYPNTNYGADQVSTISDGDRFYIKFNFTATGITTQLPSLRYYLKLYVLEKSDSANVFIYATKNNWDEGNITWNNKPSENSTTQIVKVPLSSTGWITLDVTNFIITNCMTKTCSFIITHGSITLSYDAYFYMKIPTKDYNNPEYWPHMLIQYQALTTVTQNFTITSTETVTQTFTETEIQTQAVTETWTTTVYDIETITATQTVPVTVTETQTVSVPETTVTVYETVGSTTFTITETTTETVYETVTRTTTTTKTLIAYHTETETVTTTVPVTAYQTATGSSSEGEAGVPVSMITTLFMAMLPVIIILVVLKSMMEAAR